MNPNRKIPRSLPVIILLFVAYSAYRIWPGSPGAPITVVTLNGPTMGTTYQVKLASGLLAPEAKEALQKAVQSELNKVDQAMSTYLKTSELSQFNQNKSIEPLGSVTKPLRSSFLRNRSANSPAGRSTSPLVLWSTRGGSVQPKLTKLTTQH